MSTNFKQLFGRETHAEAQERKEKKAAEKRAAKEQESKQPSYGGRIVQSDKTSQMNTVEIVFVTAYEGTEMAFTEQEFERRQKAVNGNIAHYVAAVNVDENHKIQSKLPAEATIALLKQQGRDDLIEKVPMTQETAENPAPTTDATQPATSGKAVSRLALEGVCKLFQIPTTTSGRAETEAEKSIREAFGLPEEADASEAVPTEELVYRLAEFVNEAKRAREVSQMTSDQPAALPGNTEEPTATPPVPNQQPQPAPTPEPVSEPEPQSQPSGPKKSPSEQLTQQALNQLLMNNMKLQQTLEALVQLQSGNNRERKKGNKGGNKGGNGGQQQNGQQQPNTNAEDGGGADD